MTIGDLLFLLGVDGSRLEQDATKEAQKAGDAAGKTLNQRMAASLKANGVKVLGAAFTATAAVLTKGALQMEDAVARIRSETGATAEQAQQIARTSNRVAGDQQQTLEAVTDVAIAIKKNLGATGEELDRLTEQTVKYARVTKQDGVGAVKAMDDIVDAYGLSLEDVTTVQDKLIASNQKYGGSIEENQDALAKMAPQLKALNLTYDDGIELLNLFAASGLDAADGQKALNQAIQKLPEGESLDQFVERLSKVNDDGERARLAIEVFGSKSGAKLANAIKPGITSLDAFGISAEEAAGKTEQAVEDLDSSLGGKLRRIVSQAKAKLREFGADLGPGVTAAAGLASLAHTLGLRLPLGPFKKLGAKLGGAIAAGIGSAIVGQAGSGIVADSIADSVTGATRSGRVRGAMSKLGDFMGTKLGTALGVAFAAVAIVEVVNTANRIQEEIDAQQTGIAKSISEQIVQGNVEGLRASKTALEQGIRDLRANSLLNILLPSTTQQQVDELQAQLDSVNAALGKATYPLGEHAVAGFVAGVEDAAPKAGAAAAASLAAGVTNAAAAINYAAKAVGAQLPGATAQGIRSRRQVVFDAFAQLKEDLANAMNPAKERAKLIGILTSKELAKGLRSGDPVVRAQAHETQRAALEEYAEVAKKGQPLGKKAAKAVATGLKSNDPAVRAAAQHVVDVADKKFDTAAGRAYDSGAAAALSFAHGVGDTVTRAMASVTVTLGGLNLGGKPKPKGGRALGGPVLAGMPYLVNERTARSELFVPSASGRILTHAQSVQALQSAAGGGGTTINMPVMGALPVRTPGDVITELRRAGEMGIVPPATLPPKYRRREAQTV